MTATYYVIKPTTHSRKKVTLGDQISLTESQARPLCNGGFITPDKAAADRIAELVKENTQLKASKPTETTATTKDSEAEKA
jgi:hypothetical protein